MDNLMAVKEKAVRIYKEYETAFLIVFKFVIALLTFRYVNSQLGYFALLSNTGIVVLLSLISSIIPSSVFILLVAVVVLLHLYKLSLLLMALALAVFVVFYFLYLRFAPEHGLLMVLIPVLSPLHLQFIVPLAAGLAFSPFTIVPVFCSFLFSETVKYIVEASGMLTADSLDANEIVEAYQYVIDGVIGDKELLLYGAVFALMIIVTYLLSRLSMDYAWYIAIAAGAVAGIVGFAAGGMFLDVQISYLWTILGIVLSAVLTAAGKFLQGAVDYPRKEYLQFEDDDYVYYVKAIPKLAASKDKEQTRSKTGRRQAQPEHRRRSGQEQMQQAAVQTADSQQAAMKAVERKDHAYVTAKASEESSAAFNFDDSVYEFTDEDGYDASIDDYEEDDFD